jgi:hypothetical protein
MGDAFRRSLMACWLPYELQTKGKWLMKKTIVLLLFGIAGSLLFFPLRINQSRTCLMDFRENGRPQARSHDLHSESMRDTIAQKYILPFGLLWWLSLTIAYLSTRKLVQRNTSAGKHEAMGSSILAWISLSLSLPLKYVMVDYVLQHFI